MDYSLRLELLKINLHLRIFASIEFIRVTYKPGFIISPPGIEWTRYDKSRVNRNPRFESASLASIFPVNFHDSTVGQRLESAISKVALVQLAKFSRILRRPTVSQSWRKKFSFCKLPSDTDRSVPSRL